MKTNLNIWLIIFGIVLTGVVIWLLLEQREKNNQHDQTDQQQQQQINGLKHAVNDLHQRIEKNKLGVQYVMASIQQQPEDKKPIVIKGFVKEEKKVS